MTTLVAGSQLGNKVQEKEAEYECEIVRLEGRDENVTKQFETKGRDPNVNMLQVVNNMVHESTDRKQTFQILETCESLGKILMENPLPGHDKMDYVDNELHGKRGMVCTNKSGFPKH